MNEGCLHQADKDEGRSGRSKGGDLDFNFVSTVTPYGWKVQVTLPSRVLRILPHPSALPLPLLCRSGTPAEK